MAERATRLPAGLLLSLALLSLPLPVIAGGDEQAGAGAPSTEAAADAGGSAPSCTACAGSAVKSWRIRNGDPRHPVSTKPLSEKEKDSLESDLAE